MGFLSYSELSNLKPRDIVIYETHLLIFIEKSKMDVYKQGHWFHLAKLNSEFFPIKLTKKCFKLRKTAKRVKSLSSETLLLQKQGRI